MGEVSSGIGSRTEGDMRAVNRKEEKTASICRTKHRVLFLIFTGKNSVGGGHFYSLKTISESLSSQIEYRILNIGYSFANPLKDLKSASFFKLTKENFILKLFEFYRQVDKYKPDIIHAFDARSLFVAKTISLFYKSKVVFTKCGGRNGSTFVPDADAHILFSKENLKHYSKHGCNKIKTYLIPNRAKKVTVKKSLLEAFKNEYNLNDKFIILRIARFNNYYEQSFKQSIELLSLSLKYQPKSTLVLLGQVQSEEFFQHLKKETDIRNLPVVFVNDKRYTTNASRLLPIANVVVATGRGVMEASSLNKTIFCPLDGERFPVELNDETFEDLFETNFSERGCIKSNIYNNEMISRDTFSTSFNSNTINYFNEYFNVENAIPKYLGVYNCLDAKVFRLWNYIGHFVRFFT